MPSLLSLSCLLSNPVPTLQLFSCPPFLHCYFALVSCYSRPTCCSCAFPGRCFVRLPSPLEVSTSSFGRSHGSILMGLLLLAPTSAGYSRALGIAPANAGLCRPHRRALREPARSFAPGFCLCCCWRLPNLALCLLPIKFSCDTTLPPGGKRRLVGFARHLPTHEPYSRFGLPSIQSDVLSSSPALAPLPPMPHSFSPRTGHRLYSVCTCRSLHTWQHVLRHFLFYHYFSYLPTVLISFWLILAVHGNLPRHWPASLVVIWVGFCPLAVFAPSVGPFALKKIHSLRRFHAPFPLWSFGISLSASPVALVTN